VAKNIEINSALFKVAEGEEKLTRGTTPSLIEKLLPFPNGPITSVFSNCGVELCDVR
jgi:hypothetical protein